MSAATTVISDRVEPSAREAAPVRRRRRLRTQGRISPWLLLAPALLAATVFVLFPFLNTIVLSFTDAQPLAGGSFNGLQNYRDLLSDPMFWIALRNCLF